MTVSIAPQVNAQLLESWQKAREFRLQLCHLQAPIGTGSKHVINQFQNEVAEECLTWHVRFRDNLYGWEILPTMANGLWKTIRRSRGISEQVKNALRNRLEDARLQKILDGMMQSLETSIESEGEQLQLPNDNPVLGLVLLARAVMAEFPLLIVFENLHQCHSYIPYVFLRTVLERAENTRTMVVLQTTPVNDFTAGWMPEMLLELLQSMQFTPIGISTWKEDTVQEFLNIRESSASIEDMMAWTDGRQECVAEMLAWLERDGTAIDAFSNKVLQFQNTDSPEDVEKVFRIASLFGWRFPKKAVAQIVQLSVERVEELLEGQTQLVDILEEDACFDFVLHQMRLFEDTLRQLPAVAGTVADNMYAYVGRSRPEYLCQAAMLYTRLERFAEAREAKRLLWDLDDDVLWLAMLEVLIRWNISLSPEMMEALWIRACRYQFANNQEYAMSFHRRAMEWAKENNSSFVAMSIFRIAARYFAQNKSYMDAEENFQQALRIAQVEENTFLQADIRIDLLEFYMSGSEIRRASEQLLLLEELSLSQVQRIRILGVHARLSQAEGNHVQAVNLFLEGRKLAAEVYKWGLMSDLALLAIEALVDAGEIVAARDMLVSCEAEMQEHDRWNMWKSLQERLDAM